MKKIIAIPLFLLYTMAISGMMIQLHFCGDELSSWAVNAPDTSCCCEESLLGTQNIKAADDCCSDQVIDLKINQDQNTVASINLDLQGLQNALPTTVTYYTGTAALTNQEQTAYAAHAPPGLWQQIPLYKLHQRFTYYG